MKIDLAKEDLIFVFHNREHAEEYLDDHLVRSVETKGREIWEPGIYICSEYEYKYPEFKIKKRELGFVIQGAFYKTSDKSKKKKKSKFSELTYLDMLKHIGRIN